MKKFALPATPAVLGKFDDQESFAADAREKIAAMLEAEDYGAIGVVYCGIGGGYFVPLDDDFTLHPLEKFVLLVRGSRDFSTASEYVEAEWFVPAEALEREWSEALDRDPNDPDDAIRLAEIPVEYLFEDKEEAAEWLQNVEGMSLRRN